MIKAITESHYSVPKQMHMGMPIYNIMCTFLEVRGFTVALEVHGLPVKSLQLEGEKEQHQ